MKYQNVFSRRKYALVCKTQSSVFDPNSELWVPHNMKCLGLDLRVPCITISDKQVENFVRNLDIGHVNQIPNAPGVSRTITGLVFMIIDLHLRLPHLSHKLICLMRTQIISCFNFLMMEHLNPANYVNTKSDMLEF